MKKNRNKVSQSDEVCVRSVVNFSFFKKLKATTTEALRYTEKRRVLTDISPRTQYNYPDPFY